MAIYVKAERKDLGIVGQIRWDDVDYEGEDIDEFIGGTPYDTTKPDMEFTDISGEPFESLPIADWEWDAMVLFKLVAFVDFDGADEYLQYYTTFDEAEGEAGAQWFHLTSGERNNYVNKGQFEVYGPGIKGISYLNPYRLHYQGHVSEFYDEREAVEEGDWLWARYQIDVEDDIDSAGDVFELFDPTGELIHTWE